MTERLKNTSSIDTQFISFTFYCLDVMREQLQQILCHEPHKENRKYKHFSQFKLQNILYFAFRRQQQIHKRNHFILYSPRASNINNLQQKNSELRSKATISCSTQLKEK